MSKSLHKPIKVPDDVIVKLPSNEEGIKGNSKQWIQISGPKGKVIIQTNYVNIFYDITKKSVFIESSTNNTPYKGLYRSLIQSGIHGVTKGFTTKLSLVGIGMKVEKNSSASQLVFKLGRSHDIYFDIPKDIEINCESNTVLSITGNSKYIVGQIASKIRSLSKPDPYKGKGIRYLDEQVKLKEKR